MEYGGGVSASRPQLVVPTSAFAAQANVGAEWTVRQPRNENGFSQQGGYHWTERKSDASRISYREAETRGSTSPWQEGYSQGGNGEVSQHVLRRLESIETMSRKSRLPRTVSTGEFEAGKNETRVRTAGEFHSQKKVPQGGVLLRKESTETRQALENMYRQGKEAESMGGRPLSGALALFKKRGQLQACVSNKVKHRQKFGGLNRAYSEQLSHPHITGVDALYWNGCSDEDKEEETSKKMQQEASRLGFGNSTRDGQRFIALQKLDRTKSVDPGIFATVGGAGVGQFMDSASHAISIEAERTKSLPWQALAGMGGVDRHDMEVWGIQHGDSQGHNHDVLLQIPGMRGQPKQSTPHGVRKLPRVYSSPKDRYGNPEQDVMSTVPSTAHVLRSYGTSPQLCHRSPSHKERVLSPHNGADMLGERRSDRSLLHALGSHHPHALAQETDQSLQKAVSISNLSESAWIAAAQGRLLPQGSVPSRSQLQASSSEPWAALERKSSTNPKDKSFVTTLDRISDGHVAEGQHLFQTLSGSESVMIPVVPLGLEPNIHQDSPSPENFLARLGDSNSTRVDFPGPGQMRSPFVESDKEEVVPVTGQIPETLPSLSDIHEAARSRRRMLEEQSRLSLSSKLHSMDKAPQTAPRGVSWWMVLLHYLSLIFAELPLRSHRRWLRKMYRENRIPRPVDDDVDSQDIGGGTTDSIASLRSVGQRIGNRWHYSSDEEYMKARYNRSKNFQGSQNLRRAGKQRKAIRNNQQALVEAELGRLQKRPPRLTSVASQMNLARSHQKDFGIDPDVTPSRPRHAVMRSLDKFGDILTHLNPTHHISRPSWFSGSRMPRIREAGLMTPFVGRKQKTIQLKKRKGRIARTWDLICHPISSLRRRHKKSPQKARLIAAIGRHVSKNYDGPFDVIRTQLLIWGDWVFELLSPPKHNRSSLLFTTLFPFLLLVIFFFMAGEYPFFLEDSEVDREEFGPKEMKDWMFDNSKWRTFNSAFLVRWGGRFLPLIPDEPQRWFSAIFIHENFGHLGSNALLFFILSWGLESKYGSGRTLLVCFVSGFAGNLVSAAVEDPCALVLGASGCVFGLAAFYIIDIIVDFKNVIFPFLRLLGMLAFLAATAFALATQRDASHLSHLGGFLVGWGLSFSFTPRFIDERFEAAVPWITLLTVLITFVGLPVFVYRSILPTLTCPDI